MLRKLKTQVSKQVENFHMVTEDLSSSMLKNLKSRMLSFISVFLDCAFWLRWTPDFWSTCVNS